MKTPNKANTPTIQETTSHQINLLDLAWAKTKIKYPGYDDLVSFIRDHGYRLSSFSVECWITLRWYGFPLHEREKMLVDGLNMSPSEE